MGKGSSFPQKSKSGAPPASLCLETLGVLVILLRTPGWMCVFACVCACACAHVQVSRCERCASALSQAELPLQFQRLPSCSLGGGAVSAPH